jgi:AcrR family transcriptional regulator
MDARALLELVLIHMNERRAYVMRERAVSAAATRRRILDAAAAAVWNRRQSEVRLEDIAATAEVTVQTVLRAYGTRARLVEAAWDVVGARIRAQREAAPPGDVAGTVRALFDHYEAMGDFVIRNLAEEDQLPEVREWLARGRAAHRRSMRRQFAPWLASRGRNGRRDRARRELVDCLVVVCDVYVWKLLRRDLGLPRPAAEARLRRLVSGLLEDGRTKTDH